jgi:hypothetical protein
MKVRTLKDSEVRKADVDFLANFATSIACSSPQESYVTALSFGFSSCNLEFTPGGSIKTEYSEDRPHLALKGKTPAERVRELVQSSLSVRDLS